MSARQLRPTGNRILVRPLAPAPRSEGGILLAETWQTPTGQAEILAVGGRVADAELKPGARVYYNWICGRDVEHDGQICRLLEAGEILGVTEKL